MIVPKSRVISEIRIRSGMSMRELAKNTQLNIATISNIESKSKAVSPKTAKRLCRELNVAFDEIFEITLNKRKEHVR